MVSKEETLRSNDVSEKSCILAGIPVARSLQPKALPPYEPRPGSIQFPCETCSMLLWLGPKQQEKYKDTTCIVLCPLCCKELAKVGLINTERIRSLT